MKWQRGQFIFSSFTAFIFCVIDIIYIPEGEDCSTRDASAAQLHDLTVQVVHER